MPGVTPVNGANGAETNGAVAAPKFKVSATNNDVAASSSPVAPLTGLAVLKSLSANLDRYVNSLEDAEQARAALVDAAQGVVEALRPAPETVVGWFQTGSVVSAVHVFHHWRVFDTLPAEGTMTYAELAARVGADEVILKRLAWMLASTGVLRAVGTDRLAHTAVSRILVDDEAIGSMFKAMFNLVYDVSTVMPSYFDAYGPKEPAGPAHSPVSFFEGQPDKAFFEIISQDPARTHDFMRAMLTFGHVPTTGMYDAAWVVAEAAKGRAATPLVWVDVGGSNGHSLRLFLQENPGLPPERCVVQDLPAVVEEAGVKSRDDELLGRVQWAPLNFHSETPIKGALIYYMRHILHDYGDGVCVKILRNVAAAMTRADSRILVAEALMSNPPSAYSAFKDQLMLSVAGKERTLDNFREVVEAAGLRISGIFPNDDKTHVVIECAKV